MTALPALAELERALDALEARGARAFDAPSCDAVRTLIERAEQHGGRTAELLAERVGAHLGRLRERFGRTQERAAEQLSELERTHGPHEALRETLARGELSTVRRRLRRLASSPPIRASARKRTLPPERRDHPDYEESLAELVASFALARADDVVPEHAGPYNPLRIASDLLSRMRTVSPLYLTAQLNRLEELASMMELPELPEPATKTLPRKKRGALRG